MAFEFGLSDSSSNTAAAGLVFDTDGITLIGRYSDELAAHRGRRAWNGILKSYFMLETSRDYEMSVVSAAANGYFVLYCFFTSACGRYAFWRLLNNQAPEAKDKLAEPRGLLATKKKSLFSSLWIDELDSEPQILDPKEFDISDATELSLRERLRAFFDKFSK